MGLSGNELARGRESADESLRVAKLEVGELIVRSTSNPPDGDVPGT